MNRTGNIKTLAQVLEDNPRLKDVTKFWGENNFVQTEYVLETTNFHSIDKDKAIFGLHVIDKNNIGKEGEIRQDFVILTEKDDIIYFSGGYWLEPYKHVKHKSIKV